MAIKETKTPTKAPKVDKTKYEPWMGPFAEYRVVETPVGRFAVEALHVLGFRRETRFDRKTGETVPVAVPVRRPATPEEIEAFGLTEAANWRLPASHPARPESKIDPIDAANLGFVPSAESAVGFDKADS